LIAQPKRGGRPAIYARREILNAIRYVVRSGCAWRFLPHDLPPWQITYHDFRQWKQDGTWQRRHDRLRGEIRQALGRQRVPSAAIIASQTVKTTEEGGCGDMTPARRGSDGSDMCWWTRWDPSSAVSFMQQTNRTVMGPRLCWPTTAHTGYRLRLIGADGAYAGTLMEWLSGLRYRCKVVLKIVRRSKETKGFEVLPQRWLVERTFAWLGRYRRLSKDTEQRTDTSQTIITLAMIALMTRRLARCRRA